MASRHYRFDTFELDARSRELRNADTPVALPLKSFDCLVYLIEHRDRAVGRDELISAVWGRADVSDALLGQTLARARRAIGDTGDVQGAIRTVPRFGYHWVKPIVEIEPVATTDPGTADLPATPTEVGERASIPALASRDIRPLRWSPVAWIAAVILAVALIVSAAWMLQHRRGSSPPAGASQAQPAAMTLVLPVTVADADPQSRWIRLGAMDYLASRVRERAHQPVLPSEQAIALLAGRGDEVLADPAERLKLGRSVGATRILSARVRREREGWTFVIGVQEDERTREYVGTADTPLQAADVALGAFFERIGAGVFSAPPQRPTLVELQQRIDAAFLDGDLEAASEAIEAAPVDLQKDPAIAVRAAEIDDRAGRMELAARGFSAIAEGAQVPAGVLGRARYGLCVIAFHLGDLTRGRSRCSDALAVLGDPSDPMLRGRALNLRAVIDDKLGHFDEAMAGFGLARIEWRRAGNLPGEASVDGNEAMAQARHGRFSEAMAAFERAIAVFTRFGVQDHLASTLAAKSDAQRMMLELGAALASSTQAWQLTARIGNEATVRAIGYSHALALLANGRLDEAARIIGRFDVPTDAPTEFAALGSLLLAERGLPGQAVARADAIFDLLLASPPPGDTGLSEAAQILIDAALDTHDAPVATRLLSRFAGAGASTEDVDRAFVADLAEARLSALAGDDGAADAHFRAALDHALGMNRPDLVAASASPYVLFLLERHRDVDATRIGGRLTLYADKEYAAARTMAALYERTGDSRSAQRAHERADALAGQRGRGAAASN